MTYIEYKKLKKAVEKNVAEGNKYFVLDGREYLTDYAKYLVEFMEGQYAFDEE